MTDEDSLPGDWVHDETDYEFQRKQWVNGANGNSLVIEQKREPWHGEDEDPDLSLALLPPDPQEAEPIRTILEKEKDIDRLVSRAVEHMEKEVSRRDP